MLPLQGILIQVDTSHQEEELKKEEKAKKHSEGLFQEGKKSFYIICAYTHKRKLNQSANDVGTSSRYT